MQQRVAAHLAGVFYRPGEMVTARRGDRVASQSSRRIHAPEPGPAHTQQPIKLPLLVGQEQAGPAEMRGKRGKRRRRAKPARDQPDRAAGGEIAHLYQVLLAGQSKPVPDRAEQVRTGQRTEIHDAAGARVGKYQPRQRNRIIELTRHGCPGW